MSTLSRVPSTNELWNKSFGRQNNLTKKQKCLPISLQPPPGVCSMQAGQPYTPTAIELATNHMLVRPYKEGGREVGLQVHALRKREGGGGSKYMHCSSI